MTMSEMSTMGDKGSPLQAIVEADLLDEVSHFAIMSTVSELTTTEIPNHSTRPQKPPCPAHRPGRYDRYRSLRRLRPSDGHRRTCKPTRRVYHYFGHHLLAGHRGWRGRFVSTGPWREYELSRLSLRVAQSWFCDGISILVLAGNFDGVRVDSVLVDHIVLEYEHQRRGVDIDNAGCGGCAELPAGSRIRRGRVLVRRCQDHHSTRALLAIVYPHAGRWS